MRLLEALLALSSVGAPRAQDGVILERTSVIEQRLRDQPFTIVVQQGSRFKGDRTTHALMRFGDSSTMEVKWAPAPAGGGGFNNEPRYEVAAYALQKLFLDERDYVVPPTVVRMIPLDEFRRIAQTDKQPTFGGTESVLVTMQYWALDVTADRVFDRKRAERDTAYARHLGDLNILTYLILQRDANTGNVLLSGDSANPRLLAVDNAVAFESPPSDRGTEWSQLRVKRLPRGTVTRLEQLRPEDLERALAVLAQFEMHAGQYVPVEPGANIESGRGVRRKGDVLQLGLTSSEIAGVRRRLERLVSRVRDGHVETF